MVTSFVVSLVVGCIFGWLVTLTLIGFRLRRTQRIQVQQILTVVNRIEETQIVSGKASSSAILANLLTAEQVDGHLRALADMVTEVNYRTQVMGKELHQRQFEIGRAVGRLRDEVGEEYQRREDLRPVNQFKARVEAQVAEIRRANARAGERIDALMDRFGL